MNQENSLQTIGSRTGLPTKGLEPRDLPFLNVSFSTAGIDAALARQHLKNFIRSGNIGFYVDIGCAHPIENSNTYLFYTMGWSGLCVDADVTATGMFKSMRPRDRVLNVGIAKTRSTQFYATHKKIRGMSQVKPAQQDFGPEFGNPAPVDCLPLSALFENHIKSDVSISLMSIDIEGAELTAFESNDWDRFRPTYIVMETHGIRFSALTEYPTVSYLSALGYEVTAFFGNDVLMRDTLAR